MSKISPSDFFAPQFVKAESSNTPWVQLSGAKLFLTGGSGFFGKWLLELIAWANKTRNLSLEVCLLTRSPEEFKKQNARLASSSWLQILEGDTSNFNFPDFTATHVLHAAAPTDQKMFREQPDQVRSSIVEGTARVLDYAKKVKAQRFLFTSSGGVYGRQPTHISHIPEDYEIPSVGSIDAYGEGKRVAERLCQEADSSGLETVVARCFAFSGPYLPLNSHYALGNFVRDALTGGPIRIGGDGTPLRSYLYGADLAYWLLVLLAKGRPQEIYHVGSEDSFSILEIAKAVAHIVGEKQGQAVQVTVAQVAQTGQLPARYIPSTQQTRDELGLRENFSLAESIELMREWHKNFN